MKGTEYIKIKISLIKGFVALLLVFTISCDEGFEEMNVNPNAFTDPVVGNLFTYSLIRTAGTGVPDRNRVMIKHVSGLMQYMASLQLFWYGEKYLYHDQGGDYFNTAYAIHLKELQQAIHILKDNPNEVNRYAMARIWRVYVFHKLTDIYGDVPYSEAGKGYIDKILKPKYDRQSDIYADLLNELEVAAASMDPTKPTFGAADLIYNGGIEKWKTFANSLMLRLGMHLTKVDPAMAQLWVQKAVAGGVMRSNEDMALLKHVDGHPNTRNQDAWELQRESFPVNLRGMAKVKISKNLIDMLQDRNDPRLPFYAHLFNGNIEPSAQRGLPNGHDDASIATVISGWTTDMLRDMSEPNIRTIANMNAPSIIMSYAETEFLLAEAALRNWISGSAEEHYNAAITASMQATTFYPGGVVIPSAVIEDYLAAQPLAGDTEEQMEQIHTQYYIAFFMNFDFFEAWTNWRRTGYPVLIPVNYPGNDTGGVIPRRLRYPQTEPALNTENYEAANAAQGPDLLLTRVWWDVE